MAWIAARPAKTPAAAVIDHFVAFDPTADVGAEIKRLTGGAGVDVVYDAVGGVTTPAALAALAPRGRLVVISVVGPRAVEIDLGTSTATRLGFGHRQHKTRVVDSARRLQKMVPYFESGEFRPLPIAARYSLDEAVAAYQAVADRIAGRVVINPEGGKDMSSDLTEETITEAVSGPLTPRPTRASVNCSSAWCSTCMISRVKCG